MPYAVDLFSGAGGMSEGIIQAGFHILFSSDINEAVQKTYINRHNQLCLKQGVNTHFELADIKDLTGDLIRDSISNLDIFKNKDIPHIDAIFGGPPCQGFSRAGRRDPNDPRNKLFKEYVRVIGEVEPDYVVLENVAGFCDMKLYDFKGLQGNTYDDMVIPDILKEELNLIGYDILKPRILNAANYGVPQRRNRIIIIAFKRGMKPPSYPKPTHDENNFVSLQDAIGDLIGNQKIKDDVNPNLTQYQLDSINGRTPNVNGQPLTSKMILNNELSRHLQLIKERFSLFEEGETGTNLRNRILSEGIDLSDKPTLLNHLANNSQFTKDEIIAKFKNADVDDKLVNSLLTKKNMRHRLNRNEPSATIVTIPDDYISPFENRTLTVRESARLQSFDDSFEFLGKRTTGGKRRRVEVPQYSQVGNAVPPLLAKAVACEILKVIE